MTKIDVDPQIVAAVVKEMARDFAHMRPQDVPPEEFGRRMVAKIKERDAKNMRGA